MRKRIWKWRRRSAVPCPQLELLTHTCTHTASVTPLLSSFLTLEMHWCVTCCWKLVWPHHRLLPSLRLSLFLQAYYPEKKTTCHPKLAAWRRFCIPQHLVLHFTGYKENHSTYFQVFFIPSHFMFADAEKHFNRPCISLRPRACPL